MARSEENVELIQNKKSVGVVRAMVDVREKDITIQDKDLPEGILLAKGDLFVRTVPRGPGERWLIMDVIYLTLEDAWWCEVQKEPNTSLPGAM